MKAVCCENGFRCLSEFPKYPIYPPALMGPSSLQESSLIVTNMTAVNDIFILERAAHSDRFTARRLDVS